MKNTTSECTRPPAMLPNSAPNSSVFRTSRARQVSYDPAIRNTEPVVRRRPRYLPGKRALSVIAALLIMFGAWLFWEQTVIPWWVGMQNQWNYGSSRITQIDANVGHGGECHFIAEYYKGAIVVIEIPYANTNATHTYTIPGIETDGTIPVVLLSTTSDAQTGRLNLVVQIVGTNFETVLYNTGSAFSENQ